MCAGIADRTEIGVHVPVFLWALTISIVTGLLFGLAPAVKLQDRI